MEIPTLASQMYDTIETIHKKIVSFLPNTAERDARLEELEQDREKHIRHLQAAFADESSTINNQRQLEREEIAERRRKEDEERELRRRMEDEEMETRAKKEDEERDMELKRNTAEVEQTTETLMKQVEAQMEEEAQRKWEERNEELRELRNKLNQLIDEQLQMPLPLPPRKSVYTAGRENPRTLPLVSISTPAPVQAVAIASKTPESLPVHIVETQTQSRSKSVVKDHEDDRLGPDSDSDTGPMLNDHGDAQVHKIGSDMEILPRTTYSPEPAELTLTVPDVDAAPKNHVEKQDEDDASQKDPPESVSRSLSPNQDQLEHGADRTIAEMPPLCRVNSRDPSADMHAELRAGANENGRGDLDYDRDYEQEQEAQVGDKSHSITAESPWPGQQHEPNGSQSGVDGCRQVPEEPQAHETRVTDSMPEVFEQKVSGDSSPLSTVDEKPPVAAPEAVEASKPCFHDGEEPLLAGRGLNDDVPLDHGVQNHREADGFAHSEETTEKEESDAEPKALEHVEEEAKLPSNPNFQFQDEETGSPSPRASAEDRYLERDQSDTKEAQDTRNMTAPELKVDTDVVGKTPHAPPDTQTASEMEQAQEAAADQTISPASTGEHNFQTTSVATPVSHIELMSKKIHDELDMVESSPVDVISMGSPFERESPRSRSFGAAEGQDQDNEHEHSQPTADTSVSNGDNRSHLEHEGKADLDVAGERGSVSGDDRPEEEPEPMKRDLSGGFDSPAPGDSRGVDVRDVQDSDSRHGDDDVNPISKSLFEELAQDDSSEDPETVFDDDPLAVRSHQETVKAERAVHNAISQSRAHQHKDKGDDIAQLLHDQEGDNHDSRGQSDIDDGPDSASVNCEKDVDAENDSRTAKPLSWADELARAEHGADEHTDRYAQHRQVKHVDMDEMDGGGSEKGDKTDVQVDGGGEPTSPLAEIPVEHDKEVNEVAAPLSPSLSLEGSPSALAQQDTDQNDQGVTPVDEHTEFHLEKAALLDEEKITSTPIPDLGREHGELDTEREIDNANSTLPAEVPVVSTEPSPLDPASADHLLPLATGITDGDSQPFFTPMASAGLQSPPAENEGADNEGFPGLDIAKTTAGEDPDPVKGSTYENIPPVQTEQSDDEDMSHHSNPAVPGESIKEGELDQEVEVGADELSDKEDSNLSARTRDMPIDPQGVSMRKSLGDTTSDVVEENELQASQEAHAALNKVPTNETCEQDSNNGYASSQHELELEDGYSATVHGQDDLFDSDDRSSGGDHDHDLDDDSVYGQRHHEKDATRSAENVQNPFLDQAELEHGGHNSDTGDHDDVQQDGSEVRAESPVLERNLEKDRPDEVDTEHESETPVAVESASFEGHDTGKSETENFSVQSEKSGHTKETQPDHHDFSGQPWTETVDGGDVDNDGYDEDAREITPEQAELGEPLVVSPTTSRGLAASRHNPARPQTPEIQRGTSSPSTNKPNGKTEEDEADMDAFTPRDVTHVPWSMSQAEIVTPHAQSQSRDREDMDDDVESTPMSLRSASTLSSAPSSPVNTSLQGDNHEPVIRDNWPSHPAHGGGSSFSGRLVGFMSGASSRPRGDSHLSNLSSTSEYMMAQDGSPGTNGKGHDGGGGFGMLGPSPMRLWQRRERGSMTDGLDTPGYQRPVSAIDIAADQTEDNSNNITPTAASTNATNTGYRHSTSNSGSSGSGAGSLFQRMRSVFENNNSAAANPSPGASAVSRCNSPVVRSRPGSFYKSLEQYQQQQQQQQLQDKDNKRLSGITTAAGDNPPGLVRPADVAAAYDTPPTCGYDEAAGRIYHEHKSQGQRRERERDEYFDDGRSRSDDDDEDEENSGEDSSLLEHERVGPSGGDYLDGSGHGYGNEYGHEYDRQGRMAAAN